MSAVLRWVACILLVLNVFSLLIQYLVGNWGVSIVNVAGIILLSNSYRLLLKEHHEQSHAE